MPGRKFARRLRAVDGDRGAALVEFAFVGPLLILLVIGMAEFGLAFKDRLTISSVTQAGARVGATVGDQPEADYVLLEAVISGLEGITDPDDIVSVEIYKVLPDGSQDVINTNTYTPDPANAACPWSPCPNPDPVFFTGYGGPWVPGNTPSLRDEELPGLDVLGVRVSYQHTWITGILPDPTPWAEDARVRLEPQGFQP